MSLGLLLFTSVCYYFTTFCLLKSVEISMFVQFRTVSRIPWSPWGSPAPLGSGLRRFRESFWAFGVVFRAEEFEKVRESVRKQEKGTQQSRLVRLSPGSRYPVIDSSPGYTVSSSEFDRSRTELIMVAGRETLNLHNSALIRPLEELLH